MLAFRYFAHSKRDYLAILAVAVLALGLHPAPLIAASTITYVQGNYSVPHTTTTSVPTTFTAAQAAGDLNVVVVSSHDTTSSVGSVTDTSGNTYALAVGPTIATGYGQQSIYYAKNIKAATAGSNIVTVTFATAATSPDIRVLEYSGADPNTPIDVTAANTGSSATSSSGSVTTTNATDLLFGANRVQTSTTGPGAGFTQRLLTSPNGDIAEDEMVTATGSYSATAPLSSSGSWVMQLVAFRAASTGTLPTVTSVSPNTGTTAGGASVTITGTNFASGATVTFGTAAATSVVVVSSTSITAKTPAGSAGAVTVTVTVSGQNGSLASGFTYVATPTVTGVSPNTGSTGGGTPVTITGTNFVSGATVTFGTAAATSVVVTNSTTITAVTPAGSTGAVTVTVAVSGISGSLASGFTYVVTPTVTSVSPNTGTTAGGTAVTITGTNFASGATVTFGTGAATSVVVVSSTSITAKTPAGTAGAATVTVTSSSQSGSLASGFTYVATPTVTGVSPSTGSTAGGTAVTITGTNFVTGATVTFGSANATSVVVTNGTTITAVTPAGSTGPVTVTVSVSGISGNLTSGFTYAVTPTVTSVSPNTGTTAGGTAVTITGTNFASGATVTFGTGAATSVVVVSSTSITAKSPAGTAGAVTVTVTANSQSGSLASGFTYVATPTVTGVSPNTGSTAGGTAVTITGTNFASGATVTFGAASATSVVVTNSTTITAVTPAASAGAVTVTVSVSGISGSLMSGFTYSASPTVTSVSPNTGTTAGGTAVTITGTNFASGATVNFGTAAATSVVVVSATSITAKTPAGTAGAVTVTVTVSSQSGSLASGFTYVATPTVTGVSPNGGSTAGGTAVTITGTNFASGATVTFGTATASNVVVTNSTTITATTPAGSAGAVTVTVSVSGQSGSLPTAFTYITTTSITYVQGNYSVPHTTTASVPTTYTSAQAAGDLNVVVVSQHDTTSTVSSVTDTSGNAYALAVGPTIASGYGQESIYYAKNIKAAGAGTNIVTVAFATAATTPDIRILEYSGADPNNPVDVTAANTGSSATSSSGSVTTTNASDLLFGANRVSTSTTGPGAGFTERLLTSPNGDIAEDEMVSSTGSYSASAPLSSSGSWVMQMVAFRASSGSITTPTVTSVSPNSGSALGGTAVTITGTNFATGASVTFGTAPATSVVVVSSTSITAKTPAGTAGPVTVTVMVAGQSGSLGSGFTYIAPPTVTSVTPNIGSTAGGTSVTIAGTNFASGATVTFGSAAATSVVVVSSTSITALTPAGSVGAVTVTVTNTGAISGSLASGFTYAVIPSVTSLSPIDGLVGGGTAVTITGTNFASGATVTFGTAAATNIVVVNGTTITANTPAGAAGPVTVAVTVNANSGSLVNGFAYVGVPTVSSVSPNTGTGTGGTPVTITGTNFASGATVAFGSTLVTNIVVVNSTTITANTPPGSNGAVTVTVNNPLAQTGSLPGAFTYTASINYVQGNYATPTTSQTSVPVTFTSAQIAGDLNVVAVGWNDTTATVASVTDTKGNVYTLAVGPTPQSGIATQSIYYAKNIAAANAGANIVTVTFSTAASTPDIRILEYSGADPTNPVDVTAAGTGSSTTATAGPATTTNASDLLFAANIVQTATSGPGAGFTQRLLTTPNGDIAEDEMVGSVGSYTATAPLGTSGSWIMQMVAFRTPTGGGPGSPTVTSVTPNRGSTAGGTAVTITGTNFASGATVTFGAAGATNIVVTNSTTITATAPAGSAGAATVTVTVSGKSGSLPSGYTYVGTAITYVQGNYSVPHTTTTSVPTTFTSAQAVGDLNIVVVSQHDTTSSVGSVTDTSGNAYALAVGPTVASGYGQESIYYAKNIKAAGAGTNIVTVAFATAATTPDIRILEYSGADPNNPLDVTAANTGSSATSSSGSATTTNATDLIFAANRVSTSTTGPGAGFTERLLTSPNGDIAEDETVSAIGSYSASAPLSSSGTWIMQMVAFRTSSTTPPTAPSNLSALAVSTSQINLSWTASTDPLGVTQYLVERCQGVGCSSFSQIGTSTTTTYNDIGLSVATSYSYRVRATDSENNLSQYSNIAGTTTMGLPTPTAPGGLSAVDGGAPANVIDEQYYIPVNFASLTSHTTAPFATYGADSILMMVSTHGATTLITPTDTLGNTWIPLVGPVNAPIGNLTMQFFYVLNPVQSFENDQVTIGLSVAEPAEMSILVMQGSNISSPIDAVSVINNDNGSQVTTITTPSLTTINNNDLLLAWGKLSPLGALTNTFQPGPGYGALSGASDGEFVEVAYNVAPTPASYNTTFTFTPAQDWQSAIVAVAATPNQTTLSWTASTETGGNPITTYLVERCVGSVGCSSFTQIGTVTAPAATYNDTGLTASTSYTYRVRAEDSVGTIGPYSTPVTILLPTPGPSLPADLTAVEDPTTHTQIDLAWSASVETGGTIAKYNVQRCTGVNCTTGFTTIATVTSTTYNDPAPGTGAFTYRVQAVDAANNVSPYSNPAVGATPPPAPTTLTATAAMTMSQIGLTWGASTDNVSVSYLVSRCQGSTGCSPFVQIATVTGTTYTDAPLATNTTFSYQVQAIDVYGNVSALSNIAMATTPNLPVPTAPGSPAVIDGGAGPTIIDEQVYLNTSFLTTHTSGAFGATGGDLMILAASAHQGVSFTPTDTFGNIWIPISGPTSTNPNLGSDLRTEIWYAWNPITGPYNDNITMNLSIAEPLVMSIIVVQGSNISSPIDVVSLMGSDNGTGSVNIASPSITTSVNNDLLVGFAKVFGTPDMFGAIFTSGTNWIGLTGASSNFLDAEARPNVPIGTYDATFSVTEQQTWQAAVLAVATNPNQTTVSWTPSTETGNGAMKTYLVQRCAGVGCSTFTALGTTTAPALTYNDTGLTASTSYTYEVAAQDVAGTIGPYSAPITIVTPAPMPSLPGNLTVTADANISTQNDLSWIASQELGTGTIAKYNVQRCTGTSCTNFSLIGTSTTTTYTDSGVPTGTYTYRVQAVDSNNNLSPFSEMASDSTVDTTLPTTPSGLTATPMTTSQINLSWTASTDPVGVTGYIVQRCIGTTPCTFTQLATPATNSYSDMGLMPNTTYTYQVAAVDASGNMSGYSAPPVSGTTPMTPIPSQPGSPAVVDGGAGPIVLTSQNYLNQTAQAAGTTTNFNSTGGDLIVVAASSTPGVTLTPSDSLGNTWISIAGPTATSTGTLLETQVWYAWTPNVSSTHTVTITPSAPAPLAISVVVVKGSNISSPIDAVSLIGSDNGTASATIASPGILTAGANDLLIGFANVGAAATFTSGMGFTQLTAASSSLLDTETGPGAAPGTYDATFTLGAGQNWQSAIVAVANNPNQTTLTWSPSTETNGTIATYLIQRCVGASPCSNFSALNSVTAPTTTYNDTGLTPNTSYTYEIAAKDISGTVGPYSSPVTIVIPGPLPSLPGNLTAVSAPSNTSANLSWTASQETGGTITSYVVQRCLGALCTTGFGTVGSSSTSTYTDATTAANTSYTYRVYAVDSNMNFSPYSNLASVLVLDTTPPTAPTGLSATAINTNQINLSWTASTDNVGVTGYIVQRCVTASCTFATIGPSSSNSYSDSTVVPNTGYTYQVQATDAAGNLSAFSGSASAATPVFSISPAVTELTAPRTQQFTSDGNTSVTWSVDGITGGSSSVGTITTGGLYTPPSTAGSHTVTGTTSDLAHSAIATVYVSTYPGTYTYHNDNSRSGQNLSETALTTSNVNPTQFGKLSSSSVDGQAIASPLYVANVSISGVNHNVVYVATEHDSVYAFDADGLSSAPLWKASFINPTAGVTTIPAGDTDPSNQCCDLYPEVGITSTPVIDPSTNTMYVVAATKEVSGSTNYVTRLHALDITSGTEKFGGPVVITASVSGTGGNSSGGTLTLDTLRTGQRPGLLLTNGILYIGFGGHDDVTPYNGWVLGYNATTLAQTMVYNVTPNGNGGGVWQSGGGLSVDSSGNIFFTTGNGDFNPSVSDYGDSVIKLSTSGSVVDYFTPFDQANMSANDLDLAASGPVLLIDQPGNYPHELVTSGKTGTIYVVNRDNLGHNQSGNDSQIIQSLVTALPGGTDETGNYSPPVYFNGNVYFSAVADSIRSFQLSNGLLSSSAGSVSADTYGFPGGALAISANGSTNGILWAVQSNGSLSPPVSLLPGTLFAYDATNLNNLLYTSNQAAGNRDTLDVAAKFSVPLVANGRVYVASNSQFTIYGLLP